MSRGSSAASRRTRPARDTGKRRGHGMPAATATARSKARNVLQHLGSAPIIPRFDSFRAPSIQTLRLAFDGQGRVRAMEHHASAGWPSAVVAPSMMPKTRDGTPYDQDPIDGATVGAARARSASARSQTSSPIVRFAPPICVPLGSAGRTGPSKRSGMRQR
jgi:hypothetical protein